ncbi:MAG: response regulator [Bacillota bacterium]
MPKVLLVDDEEKIRDLVKVYLVKEGFAVDELAGGSQVVTKVRENSYDLLILDLMLPGTDGLTICKEIRKFSRLPIIMLTAKGDEIDKIIGLEVGADDYIVKPFSPRELVARVKAVLRRVAPQQEPPEKAAAMLIFPNLVINPEARTVEMNRREISLTPKEFDLLLYMAGSPGRAFSRENLLEKVWGYDFYGDLRTVDTHINRLRDKLTLEGRKAPIATVWGVGYKFEVPK